MTRNNSLVSVIVPVYNTEKHIDDCIRSIVDQTQDNLEIILVNDGSTDRSGEKCDEWASKDSRIKVIHKKNAGSNYARRDGFEKSTGEYIAFVDSDDMIDKNMVKVMLDSISTDSGDMIMCGYIPFIDSKDLLDDKNPSLKYCKSRSSSEEFIVNNPEKIYEYFLVRHRIPDDNLVPISTISPCMRLIKRSLLEEIDWLASNYACGEDIPMMRQVYQNTKCLIIINRPFYFYRQDLNSRSRSGINNFTNPSGEWQGIFEFLHSQFDIDRKYIKSKGYDLSVELLWQEIFSYYWYLKDEIKNGNFDNDPRQEKFLSSILPSIIKNAKNHDQKFSMYANKIGIGSIYHEFLDIASQRGVAAFVEYYKGWGKSQNDITNLRTELDLAQQKIDELQNNLNYQKTENKNILNSKTYRTGKIITSPVRLINRIIKRNK